MPEVRVLQLGPAHILCVSAVAKMIASGIRGKASLVCPTAPTGARGFGTVLHTLGLASLRRPPPSGILAQANNILQRNIPRLTRLLGHPPPSAQPVSLNRIQYGLSRGISSGFSFPSRTILSRPLRAAGLPRAPTLTRPSFEVGLGTVRRFASHTTFRHVIEKTSITARAFWEVDWDIKPSMGARQSKQTRRKGDKRKAPRMSRPSFNVEEQLNRYFPITESSRATVLQIALAPTPSSRIPFAISADTVPLLPLRVILDQHDAYQARVEDANAIFSVLDAHNVWDRGASIQIWGDPTGLCVELRIHFAGWSEEDVVTMLGPLSSLPGCHIQCVSNHNSSPVAVPVVLEPDLPLEFMMPSIVISDNSSETSDFLDIPVFSSAHWDDVEPSFSSGLSSPNSESTVWSESMLSNTSNSVHTLSSAFLDRLQQLEDPSFFM